MPNTKFDAKSFNPQAFKYAVDRIPRTRLNEMRKSRALLAIPTSGMCSAPRAAPAMPALP